LVKSESFKLHFYQEIINALCKFWGLHLGRYLENAIPSLYGVALGKEILKNRSTKRKPRE
jgi:hypothetical protein